MPSLLHLASEYRYRHGAFNQKEMHDSGQLLTMKESLWILGNGATTLQGAISVKLQDKHTAKSPQNRQSVQLPNK